MKLKNLLILVTLSAVMALSSAASKAGPGLSLSESVKAGLMTAQAVLGKKVGQETFDDKPVLVTFFASW
jgi:cytochrome oxidase Cu insertion factor (SCO1/SenC/PrrC family)